MLERSYSMNEPDDSLRAVDVTLDGPPHVARIAYAAPAQRPA